MPIDALGQKYYHFCRFAYSPYRFGEGCGVVFGRPLLFSAAP